MDERKSRLFVIDVVWPHCTMVRRGMRFGKIIRVVVGTFVPVDFGDFLCRWVSEPMKTHIP